MVRLSRLFVCLLALIYGAGSLAAAESAEDRAFKVAMDTFNLSPELSEKDFADFVHKYPNSPRVPEVILHQAQSMLRAGRATAAIDLLSTNRADRFAPQYLYWLGCARFQNQDYAGAANTFGEMLQKFPKIGEALPATILQAQAFARLEQWPRLEQLLTQTNGLFQAAVREGTVSDTIVSGFLLLGEAQLARGNTAGAEHTLKLLDAQTPNTSSKWQRDYLVARVQRAEGRLEDALQSSASLLITQDRTNRAEGVVFQGGVQEQLGNLSAAAIVYTNNLASEVPPEQQRRAILKIVELDLKQNKLLDAVQSLTNYLAQTPPPPSADLALLTLGEVRMKQALAGSNTNLTGGETNLFQNALARFDTLLTTFTNSPLAGKALLDKGWCLWSLGKIAEGQEAFRSAVERLPFSEAQAEARFKWADTQFVMRDYASAVTNYNSIAEKYLSLPEAKERHFIERALYQSARAALNEHDLVAAASALKNILAWYPHGFYGPSVLLLTGQEYTQQNNAAAARKLFDEFETSYPDNPLLSEVRLARARTYEAESNWDAAITNYTAWVDSFPHHHLLPQALFNLAHDHSMAGRETNAMMLFTNFIARFPTNELAARAQFWVGDYYFQQGTAMQAAENNYQLVFQNTNWPVSDLAYEARMMAGRCAMERFKYKDAIDYFTNLFRPDCPPDLRVRATFAYADANISQDSTNKTADLNEAMRSLRTIVQTRGDSREAAQAWGRIGDCFFNLGATDPNQYTNAIAAYGKAIDSPGAHNGERNEARFKLGVTLEKQAAQKTGEEQTALLKEARDQYVKTFFEGLHEPEGPSLLWIKRSGLAAGQVAESLQQWQLAIDIYTQAKNLLPVLAPFCDRKISKAREHLL
jgi:TolA-binding protein